MNTDILFWAAIKGYVELAKFAIPRGNFLINDEFIILKNQMCFNDI